MKNNTCVVCGTTFEPRENKLYCSDSCKTQAYNERQEKKETNKEATTEPEQINKKPSIIYKFDMSEYNKLILIDGFKELTFEMFCFIRKNLYGSSNMSDITDYFNKMYRNNLKDLEKELCDLEHDPERIKTTFFKEQYKQYCKFLELYHSGQVEIYNSENIINLKEEVKP